MLSQLIFIKLVELLVWSQFQAYLKKMNPQDKMYFDINYKPNITQETQNTKSTITKKGINQKKKGDETS